MSVVDQLKGFFTKKAPESELDSSLSLAMPEAMVEPVAAAQTQSANVGDAALPAAQMGAVPDSGMTGVAKLDNLIALPVLGRRSVVQHQRLLSVLLGVALVLLAVVTLVALSRADRVARQIEATGTSLMQSQRLAKSVSQALVGGASAFPDVAESSGVLAKSVRGLKDGAAQLRLNALSADYQP